MKKPASANAASDRRSLTPQETALFCSQINLILKSDIPLEDGVSALCEDAGENGEKAVLEAVAARMQEHASLKDALEAAGVFPSYLIGMVEIGEASGRLENVMEEMAAFYEREDRLQKNMMNAVVYPMFLIMMMAVVLTVLVWKVLPIFRQVAEGFGASVAGSAQEAIRVGEILGIAALVLVGVLLLFTVFLYVLTRRNHSVTALFSKSRLTAAISHKISLSRFASVMYTMFVSGYQADQALELVQNVMEDQEVIGHIQKCRGDIEGGASFADAMTSAHLFSGIYGRMIGIGMKTGAIDAVMKKLSDVYGEESEEAIDNLVAIIEPVLVGTLAVIIGAVLLAVMLPLAGVMASIG